MDSGATDTGFVDIPRGKEEELMKAVAAIGPISVAIDAHTTKFRCVFFQEINIYSEMYQAILCHILFTVLILTLIPSNSGFSSKFVFLNVS